MRARVDRAPEDVGLGGTQRWILTLLEDYGPHTEVAAPAVGGLRPALAGLIGRDLVVPHRVAGRPPDPGPVVVPVLADEPEPAADLGLDVSIDADELGQRNQSGERRIIVHGPCCGVCLRFQAVSLRG